MTRFIDLRTVFADVGEGNTEKRCGQEPGIVSNVKNGSRRMPGNANRGHADG